MRRVLVPLTCFLGLTLSCSSEDDPSGDGSAGTGGSAGSASGSPASAGKSNAGSSSGSAPEGGSTNGGKASGGTASGGTAGGEQLSEACQKYCTCHDMNCATTEIPDGMSCGDFCAAMTEDQLACRQNMCKLVPDQPDNNHCAHSVGIDQCL